MKVFLVSTYIKRDSGAVVTRDFGYFGLTSVKVCRMGATSGTTRTFNLLIKSQFLWGWGEFEGRLFAESFVPACTFFGIS